MPRLALLLVWALLRSLAARKRQAMEVAETDSVRECSTGVEKLAAAGVVCLVAFAVATLIYNYWKKWSSPLRILRSPDDPANLIFGHLGVLFDSENNGTLERWAQELGDTFAFKGLLNVRCSAFSLSPLACTDALVLTFLCADVDIGHDRHTRAHPHSLCISYLPEA